MKTNTYQKLDKIFLNKAFSVPIFFIVMYLMFVFAINIGGSFQEFFDLSSKAIFVEGLRFIGLKLNLPAIATTILADGIGLGLNVALTFVPVLFFLFFYLSFLEKSGYMARAALVMDKFMRLLKLPGEAFVPMIVGFGCNVPAVLGTKGLKNRDDRILTILMTPFMSCSARLAIYAIFVAAFFSTAGQNVIFALYLIGIIVAILTGIILRRTILSTNFSPIETELPEYKLPNIISLLKIAATRVKRFILKAIQLIVPFCLMFSLLSSFKNQDNDYLILDSVGKTLVPLFKPMGIQQDNWPAVVGLLSGMVAKEVMVGSLSSLYASDGSGNSVEVDNIDSSNESIKSMLKQAVVSVPQNLSKVRYAWVNPILTSKPELDVNNSILGVIYTKFKSPAAAFSYLLFVLLYFPCLSVVVAIAKELNYFWAGFSIIWSTGVAYLTATVFYQIATFAMHPVLSSSWIASMLLTCILGMISLKYFARLRNKSKQIIKLIPVKTKILAIDK